MRPDVRRLMTMAATAAILVGALAGPASATNHGMILVIGGRAELAPSGESLVLEARYSGLGPGSELSVHVDDPGGGVDAVVDAASLPAGCEATDNGFFCPAEGTASIIFGLTATVTDTGAECPINAATTLPDPCFVVGGETHDPALPFPQPLVGVIVTMRPADADGDGIDDLIDGSGSFSDAFDDGTTHGTVLDRAGMEAYVSDVTSAGVEVIIRPVSGAAVTMRVCGEAGSTAFAAGTRATVTCGSVTVAVNAGSVVRDLGDGTTLTIGAGSTATTTDEGTVVVEQGSAELVTPGGSQTIGPEDGPVPIGDSEPDGDGDGLPDAVDPDLLWADLATVVEDRWANAGAPTAVRAILDDVQADLLLGDLEDALDGLAVLLKRSDGGRDDWMAAEVSVAFHAAVAAFVENVEG